MSIQCKRVEGSYEFQVDGEAVTRLEDPRIPTIFHRVLTSYVYDSYRNPPDSDSMKLKRDALTYLCPTFQRWARDEGCILTSDPASDPASYLEGINARFGYAGEELSEDSDSEEMPPLWKSIQQLHANTDFWNAVKRTRPRSSGLEKSLQDLITSIDQKRITNPETIREQLEDINKKLFQTNDPPPVSHTDTQQQNREALNALLTEIRKQQMNLTTEQETQLQTLSKEFYIVQYRGINYLQMRWNAPSRRYHRRMQEVGCPQFSEMVLKHLPFNFYRELRTEHDYTQRADFSQPLADVARRVHSWLLQLRASTPIVNFSDQNDKQPYLFNNKLELWQHRYSNGVREFLSKLRKENYPPGNPFFSVASTARHAMKYAYGQKNYYNEEMPLRPRYRPDGRLEYNHVGKIYVSVHRVEDMLMADCPNHLPQYNAEGRVVLGNLIAPEVETSYLAYINGPDVKYQFVAKFPSFHKDPARLTQQEKAHYEAKYGISPSLYESFKKLFSTATAHRSPLLAQAVSDLLFEYICRYNTVCFDQLVARQQRGVRVFIDEGGLLSWEPPQNALVQGVSNQPRREQVHAQRVLRKTLAEQLGVGSTSLEAISISMKSLMPDEVAARINRERPKETRVSGEGVSQLHERQFRLWVESGPLSRPRRVRDIQLVPPSESAMDSLMQPIAQLDLNPTPQTYKISGTSHQFQRTAIPGDGNCGLIALSRGLKRSITRQEFKDRLTEYFQKNNEWDQLKEELQDAFTGDSKNLLSPELVGRYDVLQQELSTAQASYDAVRRRLVDSFPDLSQLSNKQLVAEPSVVTTDAPMAYQALSLSEAAIRDYCASSEAVQGYIEAMGQDKFWVGVKSLLAYARIACPAISIVIFKPRDETSTDLVEEGRSLPASPEIEEVCLLYTGGSHFDLLKRIENGGPAA